MSARPQPQQEEIPDTFLEFINEIKPLNSHTIRPKKMNIKEFLRTIEEIYSFRFDYKSVALKKDDQPPQSLQEAAARLIKIKMKTKAKADQSAMDFISSIDYHRQSSVEADLFYRFFSK
jgi:hypothetical protein